MNGTNTIFALIDLRSFSDIWFWIALAVMWSSASHWVLGIPFDMVIRARRQGGDAAADLNVITAIHVRRLLHIARASGPWLVGFATFMLTLLGLLGFLYGMEFAQAMFLLALPMTVVGGLSLRAAAQIEAAGYEPSDLARRLGRHRMLVQAIGMISIFVTAMWGMWHNLNLGIM